MDGFKMTFDVGHPAYSGMNGWARHARYADAFRDLLMRGVAMDAAHAALRKASECGRGEAIVWKTQRRLTHGTFEYMAGVVEVCAMLTRTYDY